MRRPERAVVIGVMGSSASAVRDQSRRWLSGLARELGQLIAERGCILVTGATTGIPDIVCRSARAHGGLTIGISPAASRDDHVLGYRLPKDRSDVTIYTGFGVKGRNVINVRACDIVIILGGGLGSLNEFTIAYDEGKVVGVLEGTGGAASRVRELAGLSTSRTKARLVFESSPSKLVDACLEAFFKTG